MSARATAPAMCAFAPSRSGAAHQRRFLYENRSGSANAAWTAAFASATVMPPTGTPSIVTPSGTIPVGVGAGAVAVASVVAGGVDAGGVVSVGGGAVVVPSLIVGGSPWARASGTVAAASRMKRTTMRLVTATDLRYPCCRLGSPERRYPSGFSTGPEDPGVVRDHPVDAGREHPPQELRLVDRPGEHAHAETVGALDGRA